MERESAEIQGVVMVVSSVISKARRAIEALYIGKCTVYVEEHALDTVTKITKYSRKVLIQDQPCRLSYSTLKQNESGIYASVTQVVKLFIAPELEIPAGSEIIVTQNNVTQSYTRSGEPAIYQTHQEIVLDLYKEKA